MPTIDPITSASVFNPQNPASWLKPAEPLIDADGRDWSWCYVWHKDIEGFPGYKVGADGSVWSLWKRFGHGTRANDNGVGWERLRPCKMSDSGHVQVTLCRNRERYYHRIHVLVLEAFVGPRPPGMEACHFPHRNPRDNRLSNLRWATNRENKDDMVVHGTRLSGERHPMAEVSDGDVRSMREGRAAGESLSVLAERYGVSKNHVSLVVLGKMRRDAGGPIQPGRIGDLPEFGPHNPAPGASYAEIPGFPGYMIGSDGTLWTRRSNSGRTGDTWRPIKVLARGRNQKIACLHVEGGRKQQQVPLWVLLEGVFGVAT